MGKYSDQKLEALGLLKVKPIRDVVRELNIPYSTVLRWNKELVEIKTSEDLEQIIDTEPEIIHKLAEKIQSEFEVLVKDADVLVDGVITKIDNMQLLSEDLSKAGVTLIKKLQAMAIVCTDAKDISYLVDSVAKLQVAFFSKGTNVQVNVLPSSTTEVSKFKSLQRPA